MVHSRTHQLSGFSFPGGRLDGAPDVFRASPTSASSFRITSATSASDRRVAQPPVTPILHEDRASSSALSSAFYASAAARVLGYVEAEPCRSGQNSVVDARITRREAEVLRAVRQ